MQTYLLAQIIMNTFFSIIMPTFNQASFIRRAIYSLYKQTYTKWELIIINDGCTDETEMFIQDFLDDKRITYIKNESNQGLGHALNQGIEAARYGWIAYLPSDDYYYENHLESICRRIEEQDDLVLVYTGMKFDSTDTLYYTGYTETKGIKKGYCLQLVQTAHRKTDRRWVERDEWVSEDLFAMYWHKLTDQGCFGMTNEVTCYWTSHPAQRHKITGEKYGGGLNKYRGFYQVKTPIRMRVSKYKFIDEEKLYKDFQVKIPQHKGSLKILLLGELAYNPERIYALEQSGHQLYGLWVPNPSFCFSTVGPLPFGHVEDISFEHWREEIGKVQPDIIYGMLNFGAVSLAYDVMKSYPHIPFVWHFKEGPSICLRQGTWDKLIYIYAHAAGRIFLNETVKRWFEQFLPPVKSFSFVMDGDLPKQDYFKDNFSTKLSATDGAVHTVVAGRMIGISNTDMETLAQHNIHVHLYTENYHNGRDKKIHRYMQIAPKHFHTHAHAAADEWTKEFSQYDAGWLHCLQSHNNGDLFKASWDDLNIPARISAYAAAGLPVILFNNSHHIVATQELVEKLGIGLFFSNSIELATKLKERPLVENATQNMIRYRETFSFDYYVPQLNKLFNEIVTLSKTQQPWNEFFKK